MPAIKSRVSGLINGRRIRVTRLDGCGRPVIGDDSVAVSKGFVSVAYSANTDDGDDISVKNADGETCIFQPGKTTLNGYGIEIEFCQVDPAVLALMTGQSVRLSADGTEIVGFNVDTKIDMSDAGIALELWAGASDASSCAPGAGGSLLGYFVSAFVQGGILGDFTVENGNIDFTVTGANTVDGNSWGVGPYDVVLDSLGEPGPLNEALTSTNHIAFEWTTVPAPDPYDGLRPFLDPEADALTSIAAVVAAKVATFTPTPADLVEPTWYDFGDGSWDYLDASAMAATSHTYEKSGTYTARASTNGEWVSTSVVVP